MPSTLGQWLCQGSLPEPHLLRTGLSILIPAPAITRWHVPLWASASPCKMEVTQYQHPWHWGLSASHSTNVGWWGDSHHWLRPRWAGSLEKDPSSSPRNATRYCRVRAHAPNKEQRTRSAKDAARVSTWARWKKRNRKCSPSKQENVFNSVIKEMGFEHKWVTGNGSSCSHLSISLKGVAESFQQLEIAAQRYFDSTITSLRPQVFLFVVLDQNPDFSLLHDCLQFYLLVIFKHFMC